MSMMESRQIRLKWLAPWIEFRARRIEDPVARLRYLRKQAGLLPGRSRGVYPVRGGTFTIFLLTMAFALPAGRSLDPPHRVEAGPVLPKPVLAADFVPVPQTWLVEKGDNYEVYSNGLRVETGYEISTQRRQLVAVDRQTLQPVEATDAPVGIVYHTTESNIAPFEEGYNGRMQRVGQWLLQYIRDKQCYHYLVDRFGRVHRVVRESDRAYHAGSSVWADGKRIYLGLNNSFLGVSFESRTHPADGDFPVTAAQMRAGRALTEMLRSRYFIEAVNCVTHAQVSVNPRNMQIGNHTDWAAQFPYAELGLPDNYELPLPSMYEFGFGYNTKFLMATGGRLWKGLLQSEELVRQQATARGMEVLHYRAALKERYRKLAEVLADPAETADTPIEGHVTGRLRH